MHTSAFHKIKQAIKTIVEQKHFDINCQTRIKCDASKEGLGACLEQRQNNIWQPIAYVSRYWHSRKRDLSTTPAGCILYDGKMYIPTQLRKLIMNSIHRNHPGQSGMMHLANMIWFPRIHREIANHASK